MSTPDDKMVYYSNFNCDEVLEGTPGELELAAGQSYCFPAYGFFMVCEKYDLNLSKVYEKGDETAPVEMALGAVSEIFENSFQWITYKIVSETSQTIRLHSFSECSTDQSDGESRYRVNVYFSLKN